MRNHDEIKKDCRWIRVSTSLLDHPYLAVTKRDKQSAWMWLLTNAAWKDRRINHKGRLFDLKRGQVLTARSYLAKEWGWGEQMVRTFLNGLQQEKMIEINQSDGHYANVITICNYDKYQTAPEMNGQSNNQSLTSVQPEPNQTLTRDTNTTIKKDSPLPPKGAGATPTDALKAFEAYNATALQCGLPQAAKLTPDRQRKIIARLKDYGLDGWAQALGNIEKSSFLTGGGTNGFRADLDFMLQAKSFGKLHDGSYGNGRHTAAPAKIEYSESALKLRDEVLAMGWTP